MSEAKFLYVFLEFHLPVFPYWTEKNIANIEFTKLYYMKEIIMNEKRIYDLGREIENLLFELKFKTHDDFFIKIDKMIAERCENHINKH